MTAAPKHYLFYAGMTMTPNPIEQIGLAVSDDGETFTRTGSDGLILKRCEKTPWRNVHVCNPTVVADPSSGFLMFYQGVGRDAGRLTTSIAIARAPQLLGAWEQPDEPVLTIGDLSALVSSGNGRGAVGVIEPEAILIDGIWHMWFVVVHPAFPGNALFHAESADLSGWKIDKAPMLIGRGLGRYRIHYPHIVDGAQGWELWLTLIDERYGGHGVFVGASVSKQPVHSFDGFRQAMPQAASHGIPRAIRPTGIPFPMATITGKEGRAASIFKRGWNAGVRLAAHRIGEPRGKWGVAHPHVVGDRVYYHSCNSSRQGLQLDIGIASASMAHETKAALRPGARGAWDDFFVADPFVVVA